MQHLPLRHHRAHTLIPWPEGWQVRHSRVGPVQVHQIAPEPELLVPAGAAKVEELLLLAKLTPSIGRECSHGKAMRALVRAPSMCMPTAADGFWAECMEQAAIQP